MEAKQLEVVITQSMNHLSDYILRSSVCLPHKSLVLKKSIIADRRWQTDVSGLIKWHPTVNYLPSSKNVTTYWNRNFLTHAKIISSPFAPFNSSFIMLAIWVSRNESICIERTGGCETPACVWIVALRAGKNIKSRNHSDGRRSRDLSRY